MHGALDRGCGEDPDLFADISGPATDRSGRASANVDAVHYVLYRVPNTRKTSTRSEAGHFFLFFYGTAKHPIGGVIS